MAYPAAWSVPREWAGEPAFILGGGASLVGFDASRLKSVQEGGRGRIIAVNDAGLDLAPFADVLYFADGMSRWFGWNRDRLHLFRGRYVLTRAVDVMTVEGVEIQRLWRDKDSALSRDRTKVAGQCSGANALNLAFLFGCNPVYLLGFDMGGGHWHDNHKAPARDRYQRDFIPSLERMGRELAAEGVRVFNCNPDSALKCFPFADLDTVLEPAA
ncbi:hypothetical protein QN224_13215 [Sinorhizobium sp. 8-89]|uniref:hypothetical protein n=1 Tax=Sinorhizobium sp. 7-81 TaxID=3049087 RepID=UPI0024C2F110|nr:hypothetical protein [Sinorhizobium sp. 7-81]MDK1386369.1 hypothetical protein [Sinorhizobium sp. 7-81]